MTRNSPKSDPRWNVRYSHTGLHTNTKNSGHSGQNGTKSITMVYTNWYACLLNRLLTVGFDKATIVFSSFSNINEKKKRHENLIIYKWHGVDYMNCICRGIRPKSSLSTSILGPKPKSRTRAVRGEKTPLRGSTLVNDQVSQGHEGRIR